jgi:hypothetical protein
LGPQVLRAETAAMAALAILGNAWLLSEPAFSNPEMSLKWDFDSNAG